MLRPAPSSSDLLSSARRGGMASAHRGGMASAHRGGMASARRGGMDRSVAPIAWGGAAVMLAILVMLVTAVWASYSQALEESRARAAFIARTVERSVTRTLEAVELALVGLGETLRDETPAAMVPQRPLLQARMTDTLRFAPHIRQVVAVQDGAVVLDSRGPLPEAATPVLDTARMNLSARAAGAGLSLGLRIGARVGGRFLPLEGAAVDTGPRSVLAVGVPVTGREADLAVMAALNPDYFAGLFADAGVGGRGAISLLRFDGQALIGSANVPLPDGLGTFAGDEVVIEDGGSALNAGRVTAFNLSTRYPVAVVVTLSHRDTLVHWLDVNRLVLLVLAGVTLAVLAAIALLFREALRRVGLQRQVRLLFRAVEQASAVVVITDADRRMEYVNPEFTRLFGYAPEEALGSNPSILGSDLTPRATYEDLWRTLEQQPSWRGEFINRARDGTIRAMAATISRVQDDDGRTTHYIGVMDDITTRKAMEAEREHMIAALSRSNTEMARLTEVMSHHFQEPVRRLATFGARLRTTAAAVVDDAESRMALTFIESESRRLRTLVSDVQLYLAADLARATPGEPLTDAAPAVQAALDDLGDLLASRAGTVETAPLPAAPLDPARLRQVFGVLLKNALDHARDDVPPRIRISGETVDGMARYRVEDNGIGVPAAYRERVFRLFEKLKAAGSGTGIGLSIARRIVEGRGGRIWIEDGPDGGAAIIFELPVERTP